MQGGIKYHFLKVFGMTRPGIELRPPGSSANTLLTRTLKYRYNYDNLQMNQILALDNIWRAETQLNK